MNGPAVERTKDRAVLKDAQGKTIVVPSVEIDRLLPQPRSLMPNLLLRDLTAQLVTDFTGVFGVVAVNWDRSEIHSQFRAN